MQEDFRNRLIWGDNKLVMASLLKEFRGKIDLKKKSNVSYAAVFTFLLGCIDEAARANIIFTLKATIP